MKKRYILGVTGLVLICISAIFILFVRFRSNAYKENNNTTNKGNNYTGDSLNSGENNGDTEKINIDTEFESVTVLVNKEYKVNKTDVPKDLVVPNVKFSFNYEDEKKQLRMEAAKYLEQLFAEADKQGHELLAVSGYRSYMRQKSIYDANLLKYGYDYTWLYSAMPGTSEHQTGLAIDISCATMNGILSAKFAESKEGKWVQENAYKYGFIIRYPSKKSNMTGYGYEPWHIRYVGQELAKILYDRKITLDEYYGYGLNKDLIERDTYVYYDILLTQNSKGDIEFSQAILDDVLDNKDVENKEDYIPEDIINGLNTPKPQSTVSPQETSRPSDESTSQPTQEPQVTSESTQEPQVTSEPTQEPQITPQPTSAPTPTESTGNNNGNNNGNNGNNTRPDDEGDDGEDDD